MLTEEKLPEGTLVVTDHQQAGRGQRGNRWEAAPGQNLTCSVVFYPRFLAASEQFYLNVAVSLAVRDALAAVLDSPESVQIKWPNDLYAETRKIGGLLLESSVRQTVVEQVIVGIGLNVNQTTFAAPRAVSVRTLNGQPLSLPVLATSLCECLEHRYLALREKRFDHLKREYLRHLYRYQEKHLFEAESGTLLAGRVVGVDHSGRLALESEGKVRYYLPKEITFL